VVGRMSSSAKTQFDWRVWRETRDFPFIWGRLLLAPLIGHSRFGGDVGRQVKRV